MSSVLIISHISTFYEKNVEKHKKSIDIRKNRSKIIIKRYEKIVDKGDRNMKKAEQKAIEARVRDLTSQGIDKEVAKAMAKAELSAGLIRPVVY